MSAPPAIKGAPITDYRQLVEHLEGGCKPKADWRIGTEHEKFAYCHSDLKSLAYDGEVGIKTLLDGLADQFGWERVNENGLPIALKKGGASVSLEPGGQFELSGAPVKTLHETCSEVHEHLDQVRTVAEPLGVGMLGMGFQPKWRREDIPWMPKGRYKIMREYMQKKGNLGVDMMLRSCTIQTNLDFGSEADMVMKFRVSLALQPVVTALFANSPFTNGEPNGFVSFRSHVWTDTDPDRTGILPFVFEDGMGFERYVEHALDVPMYFVYRDGTYIDASGQSFRDFLKGRLPALPGEAPTITDWDDHLTTLFPEVRMKRFLEMRGADGGPWRSLCALPAIWVGVLYHRSSLDAAFDLVKDWSIEEHQALRDQVPRTGLSTPFRQGTVLDLARTMLDIASDGLKGRAEEDWAAQDERQFLTFLQGVIERGRTPAEDKLAAYEGRWQGSIDPVFAEFAY
ncbi:MAG: glutamate--cysteine ligase [Alphaproteobacteria bacterium]|nr:glutamate--cysteine ligase [Alphaproteobacteria bacterium]